MDSTKYVFFSYFVKILLSEIHKLINSVWNKEEFPDQLKESIIVQIHKKGD
jgi:hypothetical protein